MLQFVYVNGVTPVTCVYNIVTNKLSWCQRIVLKMVFWMEGCRNGPCLGRTGKFNMYKEQRECVYLRLNRSCHGWLSRMTS